MFSKTLTRWTRPLAVRLTIWYAGIFTASSMLAFALVYSFIVSTLRQRTDEDLQEDVAEFALLLQNEGMDRLSQEFKKETEGAEATKAFFKLWTRDGREVLGEGIAWTGSLAPETVADIDEEEPVLKTLSRPEEEHPLRAVFAEAGPEFVLGIGQSLEEDDELAAAFLNGFLLTLVIVLLLGVPVGWFLARRALRGVKALTRTATEIADGALERRVPVRLLGDELDALGRAFNTMLDRIQSLIAGMREMTDNLAHDFRSPLARIRAAAEPALTGSGSKEEWESLAVRTTEECDRLLAMIDATLDIAEAESGAANLKMSEVDLSGLLRDASEVFRTVAEDSGITLTIESPDRCLVHGDLQRLQRAVANILDNALKFTPAGGRVTLKLVDAGTRVHLSVADTGIGLTPEEIPRIFQRFYRSDRSRSGNGNGLGLSLALAFVRAHGGDITVSSEPERGSTFTVVLPRRASRFGSEKRAIVAAAGSESRTA